MIEITSEKEPNVLCASVVTWIKGKLVNLLHCTVFRLFSINCTVFFFLVFQVPLQNININYIMKS